MWATFRHESGLSERDPCTLTDVEEARSPAETLNKLWDHSEATQFLAERGREVVRRVRDWLRGPPKAGRRRAGWRAFGRWVAGLDEAPAADSLPALAEQFERTVAGLAAAIDQERPDDDPALQFRIAWQPGRRRHGALVAGRRVQVSRTSRWARQPWTSRYWTWRVRGAVARHGPRLPARRVACGAVVLAAAAGRAGRPGRNPTRLGDPRAGGETPAC